MMALFKPGSPILRAYVRVSSILSPRVVATQRWASTDLANDVDQPQSLPLPPKRPLNAYTLFAKKKFSEFRLNEPDSDRLSTDRIREIGAIWSSMSESNKQPYKELHEVQMKEWEIEYQAFLEGFPDKDEYLKQLKALRVERRRQLRTSREKKMNKKPRKLSAYNIYIRDQLAGGLKEDIEARFIEASQSWKELSAEEKERYAEEAQLSYDQEMEEFNNRRQEARLQPNQSHQ